MRGQPVSQAAAAERPLESRLLLRHGPQIHVNRKVEVGVVGVPEKRHVEVFVQVPVGALVLHVIVVPVSFRNEWMHAPVLFHNAVVKIANAVNEAGPDQAEAVGQSDIQSLGAQKVFVNGILACVPIGAAVLQKANMVKDIDVGLHDTGQKIVLALQTGKWVVGIPRGPVCPVAVTHHLKHGDRRPRLVVAPGKLRQQSFKRGQI